jgi:hypothetical protein
VEAVEESCLFCGDSLTEARHGRTKRMDPIVVRSVTKARKRADWLLSPAPDPLEEGASDG